MLGMKRWFRYGSLLILALLSVIVWGNLQLNAPFVASAIAQTTPIQSAPSGRVPSLQAFTDFGLTARVDSLIPQGLRRATRPNEGTRGVIGLRDDRVSMTSQGYPWSAIGRIESPAEESQISICTGSLVMSDVVLTNAHCIIDPETHQLKAQTIFKPNLINNRVRDEADIAAVIDVIRGTDFRDGDRVPHPDDWAFLKLDKPLGEKYGTIAWQPLSVSTLVREHEGRLTLVGYSGDFPASNPASTAGVHEGCSILGEVEDNLIHDCDSYGGSSGGPILATVDGEPRIVALNAAERVEPGVIEDVGPVRVGIVNYGIKISRITTLIQQASR
jgi:V8-like Glu-specific endopeptidase